MEARSTSTRRARLPEYRRHPLVVGNTFPKRCGFITISFQENPFTNREGFERRNVTGHFRKMCEHRDAKKNCRGTKCKVGASKLSSGRELGIAPPGFEPLERRLF